MGNPSASRRGERGFTLIEVMIAATVLIVGVLSTFKLIDSANAATQRNSARLGALGLAREIVEYARATDYDTLQPLTLENALRQRPTIAGTGTPWTIRRRNVDYTITDTVCTYDDPKDGLASSPPQNACPTAKAVNTLVDPDPDDFRRVTIKLDWTIHGYHASMTQAALVVNPSGGLGPQIVKFGDPGKVDQTGATVDWGATLPLTTTNAAGVHWNVDDGHSQGDATGGPTSWSFSWALGNDQTHLHPLTIDKTWVPDGTYLMQVQAVNDRGVPGEARSVLIYVNRHAPAQVSGLAGGYNTRFGSGVVDMHWQPYAERDVRGYVVTRDDGTQICPSDGSSYTKGTTCTDANPGTPGSTRTYTVQAVDCQQLSADNCVARLGEATTLPVTLSAGTPPSAVTSVTATIVDGLPTLNWTGVPGAQFYRIYRDTGTGIADRYDETITSQPTYTDPHPGDHTNHTYWVTAVDANFNESAPSPPVTAPGS